MTGSAIPASPGNVLEVQNLMPYYRPTESETDFNKIPRQLMFAPKTEGHRFLSFLLYFQFLEGKGDSDLSNKLCAILWTWDIAWGLVNTY